MSSSIPPDGTSQPEFLDQGEGRPVGSQRSVPGGRKKALVAGGAIVGLALAGGAAWAATWYLGSGPQPAEALPAGTLGYVSIDLDPSGDQKIEAIRTLNKFPAIEDELDLDTDDNIKKLIFDEIALGDTCAGLDYADDIEPWLGDRAAMAAVDLGEEMPTPVAVIQVQDENAAEDGLTALRDCAGGEDAAGWAIDGEWAVVAETDAIARDVADGTADASLADDDAHQGWMDEVGDAGVVTAYVAPRAGDVLADQAEQFLGLGSGGMPEAQLDESAPAPSTEELRKRLEDFEGMAMTVRFSDGAVELEMAGDSGLGSDFVPMTDGGDDVLATLPTDTAAAFGMGFADGWFGEVLDQMAAMSGMDVDEMIAQAEAETGLQLPEDVETLAGESATVSMGADFDPEAFFNSTDGTDVPFGFKVQGDPAAIEDVLARVQEQVTAQGGPELVTETDGDTIAIGVNEEYVSSLAGDGGLGDSDVFQNVVREADAASAIVFVDFDAGNDWLAEMFVGDQEAAANVAPLEGFGLSAWLDDDVAHAVMRLTTD